MRLLRIPTETLEIVLFLGANHRTVFSCCVLAHKHTSLFAVFISFSVLCHVCLPPILQQSVTYQHIYTNSL